MRTTLDLDDDLLAAAKELARRERKSAGRIVSDLMRKGLTGHDAAAATRDPADSTVAEPESFYGLRPFPSRGVVVTNEMINQLKDELGI